MRTFTGHVPGSPAYRRLLTGLFFAGVATFAQLYSVQAVLPFIAEAFEVSPATASLSLSAATFGLAATVIAWSTVADRIGRLAAMSIGLIAAAVFGMLAAIAPTLELLLAARLLEGIALGAVPAIALAYLAEEVDAGHAAAAAGSYVAGTTIGGLAGRFVAGPFGDLGAWRAGVFAVAVLCAVSAVLFMRLAPAARGFVPGRRSEEPGPSLAARIGMNLRDRRQVVLYAQGILLMGGFVAVYNYLGFRLTAPPFSLPLWLASLLFLAYLAGTVSSPWAGRLAARVGRLPVLLGSIALMLLGLLVTLADSLWVVAAGLLAMTAGFFAAHTVASGWAPAAARPEARAQAASLYYLAYYLGSSVFGWALGLVFTAYGWPGVVAGVAVMTALSALLGLAGLRDRPRPDSIPSRS